MTYSAENEFVRMRRFATPKLHGLWVPIGALALGLGLAALSVYLRESLDHHARALLSEPWLTPEDARLFERLLLPNTQPERTLVAKQGFILLLGGYIAGLFIMPFQRGILRRDVDVAVVLYLHRNQESLKASLLSLMRLFWPAIAMGMTLCIVGFWIGEDFILVCGMMGTGWHYRAVFQAVYDRASQIVEASRSLSV